MLNFSPRLALGSSFRIDPKSVILTNWHALPLDSQSLFLSRISRCSDHPNKAK
jgi:hypothetical protein